MTKRKKEADPEPEQVADLPVAESAEDPGYEVEAEGDADGGEGGDSDLEAAEGDETPEVVTDSDPGDESDADRSSGTAGVSEGERESLPEHCIRIEGSGIIEVKPEDVRQFRLTIGGHNYEHVSEEVVVGREAIWVYRRM